MLQGLAARYKCLSKRGEGGPCWIVSQLNPIDLKKKSSVFISKRYLLRWMRYRSTKKLWLEGVYDAAIG